LRLRLKPGRNYFFRAATPLLGWLDANWFNLIQTVSIVIGLIFAGLSFRRDTHTRRLSNLLAPFKPFVAKRLTNRLTNLSPHIRIAPLVSTFHAR
jgi:hypothetical protein